MVTDFLLGFAIGWMMSLFGTALTAALALLGGTIQGGEGSLGAGALIVAILSAPFLIWGTWIKHRTLGFQKEGHLTDRLAKAIEQLGAEKTVKKDGKETTEPNLEIRIGGLLSLERIAQDSTAYDKGRDHVRVMEIICAYIRGNTPARIAKEFPLGELKIVTDPPGYPPAPIDLKYIQLRGGIRGNIYQFYSSQPKPREDIVVAVNIIGRRSDKQRLVEAAHGQDRGPGADWVHAEPPPVLLGPLGSAVWPWEVFDRPWEDIGRKAMIVEFTPAFRKWGEAHNSYRGYRLDLRGVCLQGADLSGFQLAKARLDGSRLDGANLSKALMYGSELTGARLEGANLRGVRMQLADLTGAQLEGADMSDAQMARAKLAGARLEGVILTNSRLEAAVLSGLVMDGASLAKAKIVPNSLVHTRLYGVNMRDALIPQDALKYAYGGGASAKLISFTSP